VKAVVLTGIRRLELHEVPKPPLKKPNDILLKIASVGICGSDIHYYREGRIGDQVIQYPFTIGHECTAVVEAIGSAVKELKPGNRVVIEPQIACGCCSQCKTGRSNTCLHPQFFGCPGQIPGAMREYAVISADNCYQIPENLNLTQAVFAEPLSIGLYAVRLSGLLSNQKVGILGAGPIGLSVLTAVHEMSNNKIYVTDKLDYRLEFAASLGADWTDNPETSNIVKTIHQSEPESLDMVFECCGDQEALDQAVRLLKPAGKLIIVGIPETDRVQFEIHEMRRKETVVMNVHRQNECLENAIGLLNKKKDAISSLITHKFSPEESQKAFETVSKYDDHVMKAVIQFL
jgi:L-iditol 2-dehydrogenase